MAQLKGFFKKITGDSISYDALSKQPIIDAEVKLNIFKETNNLSISALENYVKFVTKSIDLQLSEKFLECKELFKKYESKGEFLNPNISHILGIVFGKLHEIQVEMHNEVNELTDHIQLNVLKPLNEYQKELAIVKENRKELKEAYDKIEEYRISLQKARKEADNAQKSTSQSSRLMHVNNDTNKKMNDINKLEDKVQRIEKELDEANLIANEKYDKYTEGLYKRIANECELTKFYLDYLKIQKRYHKQALKRLDNTIPNIKELINSYSKKPVFGSCLLEYVKMSNKNTIFRNNPDYQYVSPVIRKLIDGMVKQNVFNEEGIFRVAGSRIKMNCILYAINCGYLDYLDISNDFDVHCLAGVLKQYIRELPDSILCNEMYDDWLSAINTTPSKKLDSYKNVLNKLPRINYENIRYLIKFLAKIVENSEKTKMNSTNMGICFGVSLITNTNNNGSTNTNSANQLGNISSSSISPSSISTDNNGINKYIDMSTATNVFDFLLTNHKELFPDEINFIISNTNSLKLVENNTPGFNTFAGYKNVSFLKATESFSSNNTSSFVNNNQSETANFLNNKNESFNEKASSVNQNFNYQGCKSNNEQANFQNTLTNFSNTNRHMKNNSADYRSSNILEANLNQTFQSAIFNNSSNQNESISPKLRNKKQAPAPPQSSNLNPILQTSIVASINSLANEQGLFENENDSHSFNYIKNNETGFKLSSTLEKPSQAPPDIPNRPPPIGFNINTFPSDSQTSPIQTTTSSLQPNSQTKNKNLNIGFSQNIEEATQSTINSDQDNSQSNNISFKKQTKPLIPRKPGTNLGTGHVASQINKFQSINNDPTESNSDLGENSANKLINEITSL